MMEVQLISANRFFRAVNKTIKWLFLCHNAITSVSSIFQARVA